MLSSKILGIVTFSYLFCSLSYFIYQLSGKKVIKKFSTIFGWFSFSLNTAGIGLRWIESYKLGYGHAPLANFYESLVFFAWATVLVYLVLERMYEIGFLGSLAFLFSFLTMAYASLSPNVSDKIEPLVPALKSNWLIAHVVTCFLGYAAFAVSFLASLGYFFPYFRKKFSEKLLDEITYKAITIGFSLLTVGIITGAAWANYAWGSYWSWDPKETWSLITWLIYAAYLHARFVAKWSKKVMFSLSIVGFFAVIFTYLGVNFILSGLHSYL